MTRTVTHPARASESSGETAARSAASRAPRAADEGRELARVAGRRTRPVSAFPLAGTMRSRLGLPVPGEAVVDAAGCAALGVDAFTDGPLTHFSSAAPRLPVVAHEAAHQLQHAGLTRDAGLGAEGHAQAVASAVADSRSATHLIGRGGRSVAPAARPYAEIPAAAQAPGEWDAGGVSARVADDGQMAVRQDAPKGSKYLWASEKLIAIANNTLVSKNSPIRLRPTSQILVGTPPAYAALGMPGRSYLFAVEPQNVANQTAGTTMQLWADCGYAAREVMGIGSGVFDVWDMTATWVEGGVTVQTDAYKAQEMADEIVNLTLAEGRGAEVGWQRYQAMSSADRERFDKEHGINAYVDPPEIGEGFAIEEGGVRYPGASTWNFHVAAVVMVSGEDSVVLENYSVGSASVQNDRWDFQMFGPLGQTFHELHAADLEHGTMPTTVEVGPR